MGWRLTTSAALVAMALGAPATADAARITIGSDLAAPATMTEAWPVDSAFWPARQAAGTFTSPVRGQAIIVRLKGTIQATPGAEPFDRTAFQVLRPRPDGLMTVIVTSEDFTTPTVGDEHTVKEHVSSFLCVEPGDVIAFSHSGGYDPAAYPNGTPFRVFGAVPGSATNRFTGEGKDNNGNVLRPNETKDGQELLMQVVIGTGGDARPACGGTSPYPDPGNHAPANEGGGDDGGDGGDDGGTPTPTTGTMTIPKQKLRAKGKRVKVRVKCVDGPCAGTLEISRLSRTLAAGDIEMADGETTTWVMKLRKWARKKLRRGDFTVKLRAGDGPSRNLVLRKRR